MDCTDSQQERTTPRIAVYTAITGNYETLQRPRVVAEGVDYLCFTDSPRWLSFVNVAPWRILPVRVHSTLGPIRTARKVKILFHRVLDTTRYSHSIWVDGNVDTIGDVQLLIEQVGSASLTGFRHPFRDCIYEEGDACIREQKDDPQVIQAQLERYRQAGYPAHQGLTETNVLIRRHDDPALRNLMEAWWAEIEYGSRRDQLSFCYVAWQLGFRFETLGETNSRGSSPWFRTPEGWRSLPAPSRTRVVLETLASRVRSRPILTPCADRSHRASNGTGNLMKMPLQKMLFGALTVNLGFFLVLLRVGPREALDRLRRSYAEMQPFQRGINRLNPRGPNLGRACAITAVVAGYCRGQGLEVGPGSKPYCSHDHTEYLDRFTDRATGSTPPDIVADAAAIPRPDGSYDFVFSSHALEHHPNTIAVLNEWRRVLKENGVLVLVLPHKERTFDHGRTKTTLAHHIDDFARGVGGEDETHLAEWETVVEATIEKHPWSRRPEARNPDGRLNRRFMVDNGYVHFHVWDQDAVVRLLQYLEFQILFAAEDCADRSDSFMVVARATPLRVSGSGT